MEWQSSDDQVQRDHCFCIIDEVDSILIDEANTFDYLADEDNPLPFKSVKPVVQNLVLSNKAYVRSDCQCEAVEQLKKTDSLRQHLALITKNCIE